MDLERDRARYEADRAKDLELAGTHGIDAVMKAESLDALLFPGVERRRDRGAPGLSDRDRAVRHGAERADAALPGGLRREARALRRELHRPRVQRAAADRARLRVRAGDEAAPAAGAVSLIQLQAATLAGKPIVEAASGTSCSISASETPSSSALRTAERAALSRCAPMAIASLTSRCVRTSSGPAAASSLASLQARPSSGKRRTKS